MNCVHGANTMNCDSNTMNCVQTQFKVNPAAPTLICELLRPPQNPQGSNRTATMVPTALPTRMSGKTEFKLHIPLWIPPGGVTSTSVEGTSYRSANVSAPSASTVLQLVESDSPGHEHVHAQGEYVSLKRISAPRGTNSCCCPYFCS
jgi:hypothetical protein